MPAAIGPGATHQGRDSSAMSVAAATMPSAGTSTATPTGTCNACGTSAAWRPAHRGPPDRPSNDRTSGVTGANMAVSTVPTMPTPSAAPAKTAPPGVAAPVEARTAPAVIIPAVVPPAEEELGLFDLAWNGRRREAIDRQGIGLADGAQGQGNRSGGRVDPMSHERHLRSG
jgi:hypothetical protein